MVDFFNFDGFSGVAGQSKCREDDVENEEEASDGAEDNSDESARCRAGVEAGISGGDGKNGLLPFIKVGVGRREENRVV